LDFYCIPARLKEKAMSKSRKPKKAANQESLAEVQGLEVGSSEERVPTTIVESTEEQVFANQEEQNREPATEQAEKPAKPRVSKRPYIADVEALLIAGSHTKKTLLAFIMEKYSAVSKGGASAFITDLCNVKYNHFKPRAVVKLADDKLQFADMVPAASETLAPEVLPEAEPAEKPAE
jgi:hypothetical protein